MDLSHFFGDAYAMSKRNNDLFTGMLRFGQVVSAAFWLKSNKLNIFNFFSSVSKFAEGKRVKSQKSFLFFVIEYIYFDELRG